jgi:hypothetical protein
MIDITVCIAVTAAVTTNPLSATAGSIAITKIPTTPCTGTGAAVTTKGVMKVNGVRNVRATGAVTAAAKDGMEMKGMGMKDMATKGMKNMNMGGIDQL